MSLLENPSFSPTKFYDLDIRQPGSGGINLNDLEYDMNVNQSPNMLNVIYRNGSLSKRFGQTDWLILDDHIDCVGYFGGEVVLCADGNLYMGSPDVKDLDIVLSGMPGGKANLISFNRKLYFWSGTFFYVYDPKVKSFEEVEPYVPDIVINRKPDGTYSDIIENYNRIGAGFKNSFNGDGTSTVYKLTDQNLDKIAPIVVVDGKTVTNYTVDYSAGTVTFTTAPVKGQNNVVITAYKKDLDSFWSVANFNYYKAYGGNNNSRLFVGGCGDGKIYYSDILDITYFPEMNYMQVGNDEDDVTGFGEQYDVLMVFKPKEIFSIDYYLDNDNKGAFMMKQVNGKIGCDAPDTIQLINNQLTWLSTTFGVCTLVSTNIEDERNVRVISRNVNGGRTPGLMQENKLQYAKSVDFNGKYIISTDGKAYLWDYLLTPYQNTGDLDADAGRLAWFVFDNFNVDHFIKTDHNLFYSNENRLIKIVNEFSDFGEPIHAVYQTPYFQFNAESYLKTVKNIYVQTRADTATEIDLTYFTEDTPDGEKEPEPIRVYDKLWRSFRWNTFGWQFTNIANTFRRKCSLKKIQMCSIKFENNELNRDLSISHLGIEYTLVKKIK